MPVRRPPEVRSAPERELLAAATPHAAGMAAQQRLRVLGWNPCPLDSAQRKVEVSDEFQDMHILSCTMITPTNPFTFLAT